MLPDVFLGNAHRVFAAVGAAIHAGEGDVFGDAKSMAAEERRLGMSVFLSAAGEENRAGAQ